MTSNNHHDAFAEVIESSLTTISGLCWDEQNIPPFGSLVQVSYGAVTSYGIITNIVTASSDDSRTPFAFKQTLEALKRNQPQIFAFIQTTCSIVLTWHSKASSPYLSSLPVPYPAPLHAWIQPAPLELAAQALTNPTLLEGLTEAVDVATTDDCLVAIAAKCAAHNALSYTELVNFIEKYSQEINTDLQRARRFLQHMEHILKTLRK